MQNPTHEVYSFDEFRLDVTRGALFCGEAEIRLRPKSYDVLKYLIENQGRLVGKNELIDSVWNGTAVTDDSLVQCLKDIRRALDDDDQSIIKTVPRRGYVFDRKAGMNGNAMYFEEISGVHMVIEETEDFAQPELAKASRSLFVRIKQHKLITALILAPVVLAGIGIAYGVFVFLRRPAAPFRSVTMTRLTSDGKAVAAAITPDGKYVAYATQDGGKETLWVRQVAAVNVVRLDGPSDVPYRGLFFSRDGNFLFYDHGNVLYQMGTHGGSVRKLWDNVTSTAALSPDGKRIAFIRVAVGDGLGSRLVLANADGSGEEQVLAYRKSPESFTVAGCGWSPDGETLVCAAGDNIQFGQQYPLAVRLSDGTQTKLTKKLWNLVRPPVWMSDGSGFIMTAWENRDSGAQLWHVRYPDGGATKIHSDLNDYASASLTADSSVLLAIQRQPELNIHVMSLSGDRSSKQLTFGTSGRYGFEGISSLPDGKIVYSSEEGSTRDLWIMNPDGSAGRRLTFDELSESNATVSPDGNTVVYGVASRGIWRTDLDGGSNLQLTQFGMFPVFSADGQWVYYSLPNDGFSMWKVATDGGEPVRVTDHPGVQPDVSPDGKWIAYMSGNVRVAPKLYIASVDGGEPVHIFEAGPPVRFDIHWMPDGGSVAYTASANGIQQIVRQPLTGGKPEVLLSANGESEGIAGWGFSRDGKELFYSFGPINRNIVMFTLAK